MSIKRYLRQRRQGWYVAVAVPTALRPLLGKKEIVRSLNTRSLEEANRRKWGAITKIKGDFEQLRGGAALDPEAFAIRKKREQWEEEYPEYPLPGLEERTQEIEQRHGVSASSRYWVIATGQGVPVSALASAWLKEVGASLKQQTKAHREGDVGEFIKWADNPMLSQVTRQLAGRYMSEFLLAPGHALSRQDEGRLAPATIQRKVSALGSLWKWMGQRGYLKETARNPWEGQLASMPRGRKRTKTAKRPLMGPEVNSWLAHVQAKGHTDQADLITLGLWTGARLDELCSLNVEDIQQDGKVAWLSIAAWEAATEGKSKAAVREVPVVAKEPLEVLKRLIGKRGAGQLVAHLEPAGLDNKLSHNIQKRLGTSRSKALGKETPVDFHSLRRAYLTCAERAGVDSVAQARLVGHEAPTLAAQVYSGGAGRERLAEIQRAIVKEIEKSLRE